MWGKGGWVGGEGGGVDPDRGRGAERDGSFGRSVSGPRVLPLGTRGRTNRGKRGDRDGCGFGEHPSPVKRTSSDPSTPTGDADRVSYTS